jgi:hypothetical protein
MLSKLNDFYIIEKLSESKYLKWSFTFYLKLQAKSYHEKKSWKLKRDLSLISPPRRSEIGQERD